MNSTRSTENTGNDRHDMMSIKDKKIPWTEAIKMLMDLSKQ